MTRETLGGEDAAWLHMEDPTNPMVVTGLVELAEPLSVARVTGLLDERLASIPRFRARVVEPRARLGAPRWEPDPAFDVSRHVVHVELASAEQDALRAFIDASVSTQLERDRPLWRAYVIDRPGAGTAVLCRIHHAIADGFALLGVLGSLCDADTVPAPPRPHVPPHPRNSLARDAADHALSLARLVTLPRDPATPIKGHLSREKRVAWSEPIALADVKALARAESATVNDVLVAAVSGALRRHLAHRGVDPHAIELRAMLPVNLRTGELTALGNRFGMVLLALPIGAADPRARLAEVKRRMGALKTSPEPVVTYALLTAMGFAPRPLEDFGVRFFGKKATLVLTNVPGPRERLKIAGVPVQRIVFWVPQSGRMGLGVSILSYAGEVTVGVMADAQLVPDPTALVAELHVELAALASAIRAEAARAATHAARPG